MPIEEDITPTNVIIRHCRRCGKVITDDNESEEYSGYCCDCADRLTKCADCGVVIDIDCAYRRSSDNEYICTDCYDDHYTTCHRCGEVIYRDDAYYIEDLEDYVCTDCYDSLNCFLCEDCDCYYTGDEWNDGNLCNSCYEERNGDCSSTNRVIENYSRRIDSARQKMFQKTDKDNPNTKLFYGIELEVLANNVAGQSDDKSANKSAAATYNVLGKENILIKYDGSLDTTGYEIVSVPMTFNRHIEFWDKFFRQERHDGKMYAPGLKSYDTNCCGMHIHISRKALNLSDICKIVFFINEFSNTPFCEFIASRSANNYCIIKNKNLTELNEIAKNGRSYTGDRYEAVNLTNRDTVEIRIFRGTIEKMSFFKNLEFVDCLIKFIHSKKSFLKLNWKEFLKFLKKNYEKYPNLYQWILNKRDTVFAANLMEVK